MGHLAAAVTPSELQALMAAVAAVHVAPAARVYVLDLVEATRTHPAVRVGASPRAALSLLRAARAVAVAGGRDYVTPDDIQAVAGPALAHRLLLHAGNEAAGGVSESVVREVLDLVPAPLLERVVPSAGGSGNTTRRDSFGRPAGGGGPGTRRRGRRPRTRRSHRLPGGEAVPTLALTGRGAGALAVFAVLVAVALATGSLGPLPLLAALGVTFLVAPLTAWVRARRALTHPPVHVLVHAVPATVPVGGSCTLEVVIASAPDRPLPPLGLQRPEGSLAADPPAPTTSPRCPRPGRHPCGPGGGTGRLRWRPAPDPVALLPLSLPRA